MNRKEATSLLASGLAITAGVLSPNLAAGAALVSPEVLIEGLKTFGGLGIALAAEAIQKHLVNGRPEDDVLKNGDLTRAIGKTVFAIFHTASKEASQASDAKSLRRLSMTSLETWEGLVLGGGYKEDYGLTFSNVDLEELSADRAVQFVGAQSNKLDDITALSPSEWQAIIDALCGLHKVNLTDSTKQKLAEKLYRRFPSALRRILVADFAKDGKAYASLQFRILGEILGYLHEISLAAKDDDKRGQKLLEVVTELSNKVASINRHAPDHYSPENGVVWETICKDFRAFEDTLSKTHQNTEYILGIVRQILERHETGKQTRLLNQKLFPVDFPKATRFFTGRKELLESLKSTLLETGRACLHDLSGIGKTSVILKYAELYAADYDAIFFLKPTSTDLLAGIWESVQLLELSSPAEASPDDKMKEFHAWLTTHRNWLVIFDNVTDTAQAKEFTTNLTHGHFLFTSNLRDVENLARRVEIHKFGDADSRTLLYRRGANDETASFDDAPPIDREAITRIVQEFDGLPLALNICGSFIFNEQLSFSEFHHDIFEAEDEFDQYEFEFNGVKYKSFGKVFKIAFAKLCNPKTLTTLEQDRSEAISIALSALSFLAPNAIPQEIIRSVLESSEHARFMRNEEAWIKFRQDLTRFDLIQFKSASSTFETHRLIQEAIKRLYGNRETNGNLVALSWILRYVFPESHEYWKFARYMPHALSLIRNMHDFAQQVEAHAIFRYADFANLYSSVGYYLGRLGKYAEAESLLKEANAILEKELGPDDEDTLENRTRLGNLYILQGKHREARPVLVDVLQKVEGRFGKDHRATLAGYMNLATVQTQEGTRTSEKHLLEIVKNYERTLGTEHPETVNAYSSLGLYYLKRRKIKKGEALLQKCLDFNIRHFGEDHPRTAASYLNLSSVAARRLRFKKALGQLQTALAISAEFLEDTDPLTVKIKENIKRTIFFRRALILCFALLVIDILVGVILLLKKFLT